MIPAKIIAKKRDRLRLTPTEIRQFLQGFLQGEVTDYQMSAFAMAVLLNGMDQDETVSLTAEMLASGNRLPRSEQIDALRVDKHSTGGLGDKVSLILAPLLAEFDFHVPMISGRGLGITGGTLDKLEAIDGFQVNLTSQEIQRQCSEVGCVIAAATDDLVPVDRRLYAIRDVTATVESVPLITASILSKKLAEQLDALVLDVKWGSGSFMKTMDAAQNLAGSLVNVAQQLGLASSAVISSMNQPLGRTIGNAIEVNEAVQVMQGNGPEDLVELTITLAATVAVKAGRWSDEPTARQELTARLNSGHVLERFWKMVQAQGGQTSFPLTVAERYPVLAEQAGYVQALDGQMLGECVIEMGGGRRKMGDVLDHAVGIEVTARIGQEVSSGQPLAFVHRRSAAESDRMAAQVRSAFTITETPVEPDQLIALRID